MSIESPCIMVCSIHRETGWCHGCGRTVTEIMDWGTGAPEWRTRVFAELPDRIAQIPKGERRLTKRRARAEAAARDAS